VEALWSALCACWPNNLKVILRYLLIVSGMSPEKLLPYVSTHTNEISAGKYSASGFSSSLSAFEQLFWRSPEVLIRSN
jgi:hypothetical protein